MRRRKNTKLDKMKKDRWEFYKASQYRNSWRSRCKKINGCLDDVPSREVIQKWLESIIPYRCYITGEFLNKRTMQADHKKPISKGGSFKLDNIGITSKRLNQIKGDMSVEELKSLIGLVSKWEDKGESLFKRLLRSSNIYRKRHG